MLRLSGESDENIMVTVMIAGSATRIGTNLDYTLTATTVMIPAGMRDAIIRLDVNNDDLYDGRPHETVVLSLVSEDPSKVTVDSTKDDHTVTITDNDDAADCYTGAGHTVRDRRRALRYSRLTLSHGGLDEAVTLELAVSNGSSER